MIYVMIHIFFDNLSIMYPPSYFVNFLLVLWAINKDIAQYFYPYVYATSVLGIMYSTLFLCFEKAQDFHSYFFLNSSVNNIQDEWKTWFLLSVMLYKTLLIYSFPYNMNKTAMLYSINFALFYVSCMLIYIYRL